MVSLTGGEERGFLSKSSGIKMHQLLDSGYHPSSRMSSIYHDEGGEINE